MEHSLESPPPPPCANLHLLNTTNPDTAINSCFGISIVNSTILKDFEGVYESLLAIMIVFEFPPRLSFRSHVSTESL